MDPAHFLADLEAKPAALARLGSALAGGDVLNGIRPRPRRVVLLGMGSSRFAARGSAQRLRAAGLDAVAEYASAELATPPGPGTLVIGISASGESVETLAAAERHAGRSTVVALTNEPGSRLASLADFVVPMLAGEERGGVACRTFQHTVLLLLAIEASLVGVPADVPGLCHRVAEASADLLVRRDAWLPPALRALDGPDGIAFVAPVERLSSAEQSALMVREGPRRAAIACETGDWSHVDVYLTKTLDYRAVLFRGSRWEAPALRWLAERRATVVAVGAPRSEADDGLLAADAVRVRYAGDTDPMVALATETLVAELVAARWWGA